MLITLFAKFFGTLLGVIICMGALALSFYLLVGLEMLVENIKHAWKGLKEQMLFGPYYPEDFDSLEDDLVGFPYMGMRDFSGDDTRESVEKHLEATTQAVLPKIFDNRLTEAQKKKLIERNQPAFKNVTPVYEDNIPDRKNTSIVVLPKKEEKPYELRDLKDATLGE